METTFSSPAELEHIIAERGFLPFFNNDIPNFSIAEFTPKELWFSDEQEGPWEWKGPVIIEGDFAYGKFFQSKAGYISMDWFPDFVNYRRSICELSAQERIVLGTISEHKSLLSKEIKRLCGYVKPRTPRITNPIARVVEKENKIHKVARSTDRKEGYETVITRLQMATMVVTADFEYLYDKTGKRYGWGVARYCTPEDFFGAERLVVNRSPEESYQRMFSHLKTILPWADDYNISKLLG
jgi:hypothetical protein